MGWVKMNKAQCLCLSIIVSMLPMMVSADEPLTVTVSKLKGANLRVYGFVETDYINDTTQSFTESQGGTLVQTRTVPGGGANNFAGQYHRTIMSIRNSRFGFDLTLPKTDSGLASEAIFEMDFFANDATNTLPGTTPGAQTESDFFT